MEYSERDRCFRVRSVYRTQPEVVERLREIRIDLDETLVGRAARERRPIAVSDLRTVDLDPHLRILHDAGWRSLVAVPMLREDQIVGSLIVRRKETGDFTEENVDLLETFASQSALALLNAQLFQRAQGAERRAGAGQPAQVGVPGQHVARAADAAERRPRVLRGPARADVRRDQRAPGGVPPRHPRVGQAPAGAAQRDPGPVQGRGRPHGARVRRRSTCPDARAAPCRCCASGPRFTASRWTSRCGDGVGEVYADELRLKQVLLNLLTNAVKFTGDGGTVTVRADRDGGDINITVTDTGIGVPEEGPGADLRVVPARWAGQLARGGHRARPDAVASHRGAARGPHVAGDRGRRGSTFGFSIPHAASAGGAQPRTADERRTGRSGRGDRGRPAIARPVRRLPDGGGAGRRHRARRPVGARRRTAVAAGCRPAGHPAARHRRLGGAEGAEGRSGDARHPGDRRLDRRRADARGRRSGPRRTSSSRSAARICCPRSQASASRSATRTGPRTEAR